MRSLMKILYESLFFDPTSPRDARGPGHVIHRLLEASGVEVEVLGPPAPRPWAAERFFRKLHRRLTGRRYLRFPLSQAMRASAVLNEAVARWRPDVVLTMFPAALWRYRGATPVVYRVDVTYEALDREYPDHGWSPFMARLAARFQARACLRSTLLVTHSEWSRKSLEDGYGIPREKIRVFPNTGGLAPETIPTAPEPQDREPPLELLFVGLDARRKGLDLAIETVRLLNETGLEARLTVCGLPGRDTPELRFVGPFDKSRPEELDAYAGLYREAGLLLHPARFDPSPMVTAEAAAHGLPVVTRDVAGLSASVIDGETGLVLPADAPAGAYARAIRELVEDPARYRRLGRGARERYDRQLAWDRFGERLLAALSDATRLGRPPHGRRSKNKGETTP